VVPFLGRVEVFQDLVIGVTAFMPRASRSVCEIHHGRATFNVTDHWDHLFPNLLYLGESHHKLTGAVYRAKRGELSQRYRTEGQA
jgi:hypothetical protein